MLLSRLKMKFDELREQRELRKFNAEQEKLRSKHFVRLLVLPKRAIQRDLQKIEDMGYTKQEAMKAMRTCDYDYEKAVFHLFNHLLISLNPSERSRTSYAAGKLLKAEMDTNLDEVLIFARHVPHQPWLTLEYAIAQQMQEIKVKAARKRQKSIDEMEALAKMQGSDFNMEQD